MLDQLIGLVKQFSGDAIVNNPAIPNEKNEEVMAEASNTVAGGLQNMLAGGGLQNILSLFSSGGGQSSGAGIMQNPIANMMVGHFMKKLMSNFGMNSDAASGVANSVIPNVLNGLISKTKDPNDNSIDLNNIIHSLTGGNVPVAAETSSGGQSGGGFDFQGLLNKFIGGGNSGGGGGLQDIISRVTHGAQQNQQQQAQQGGGGGLMDIIKGLF